MSTQQYYGPLIWVTYITETTSKSWHPE